MFRVIVNSLRANDYASISVVNSSGSVIPQDYPLAAKFPNLMDGAVTAGTVWDVDGSWEFRTYKTKSGFEKSEKLYTLSSAEQVCPEGQTLAIWIEKNVDGIGEATAVKLVRGIKDLNSVVNNADIESLIKIDGVSEDKAHKILMSWPEPHIYNAIKFLSDCGLPPKLADPITKIYGGSTEELIRKDPFLLVPLGVPFSEVESLIERLDLEVSQAEHDAALAEEIVHENSMKGSTVVPLEFIKSKAIKLGYEVSDDIANNAVKLGSLIEVENGFQTIGMARMEAIVGHSISGFLDRSKGEGSMFANWELAITPESVSVALDNYEKQELGFSLTAEQREAVLGSILSPVSCISGGAGVGKTTILKAILGVYESFEPYGLDFNLMALSGRAAQRMNQSTGYPAITIAKYIYDTYRKSERGRGKVDQTLVIIDEASMVDLHSMYNLVKLLPDATRLILVGDTAQLPPVGGGLVFHELVKTRIPTFHLTAVKRQGEDSGIHAVATQIRDGKTDEIELSKHQDITHISEPTLEAIEEAWRNEGGFENVIVLAPTNGSELGVDSINAHIQTSVGLNRKKLHFTDKDGSQIPWRIKGRNLLVGDQVMVTSNDYGCGIRNGDLATITEVFDEFAESDNGQIYGTMELDGKVIDITNTVIEKLDLGYAVTIHKSQGSQWKTVLVVLSEAGRAMMDRSLLYTAVTRPQEKLYVFGELNLLKGAVKSGNAADKRVVGLQSAITPESSSAESISDENIKAQTMDDWLPF